MGKIYINLHPEYDYATVILAEYIDLKEYVRDVSWIDWFRIKRGHLHIRGKSIGGHVEKTHVFAERMYRQNHTVLIRNTRKDEFAEFTGMDCTEEYMRSVESEAE